MKPDYLVILLLVLSLTASALVAYFLVGYDASDEAALTPPAGAVVAPA